jgi:hypothetical protein
MPVARHSYRILFSGCLAACVALAAVGIATDPGGAIHGCVTGAGCSIDPGKEGLRFLLTIAVFMPPSSLLMALVVDLEALEAPAKPRPYRLAFATATAAGMGITALWLSTGGDDTCAPNGCGVPNAIGFFLLLVPYVVPVALLAAALVRRGRWQRFALILPGLLVIFVLLLPPLLAVGHNPQGEYCAYLERGEPGGWLAIDGSYGGPACELVWSRLLFVGLPWLLLFWVAGFIGYGIYRIDAVIRSRARRRIRTVAGC